MAQRRMITRYVTDDDNFMSLSSSAQALYLHLNMGADDDGFNNQVTVSMFKAHASVDDLKALLEKRYIYQFENGVIVIKHWRMANALRKDRYTPTVWQEEKKMLQIKDNEAYTMQDGNHLATNWQPNGNQTATQVSIGKDSIGKVNNNGAQGTTARTTQRHFVKPSMEEVHKYFWEKGGSHDDADRFYDYYESNGWTIGKQSKKMSDWKASVRNWLRNDFNRKPQNKRPDFLISREEPSEEEQKKAQLEAEEWFRREYGD